MKSIIVDGVKCERLSDKTLRLTLLVYMNAEKLQAWKEKNRKDVLKTLNN
jgi:hypothetical protein